MTVAELAAQVEALLAPHTTAADEVASALVAFDELGQADAQVSATAQALAADRTPEACEAWRAAVAARNDAAAVCRLVRADLLAAITPTI